MEDFDLGVVYDVLSKNLTAERSTSAMINEHKIVYGGNLNVDLTKEVGSLGELVLVALQRHEPDKIAFVS